MHSNAGELPVERLVALNRAVQLINLAYASRSFIAEPPRPRRVVQQLQQRRCGGV